MKKALVISGVVISVLLVWYLFLRPFDYKATFRIKTLPGTINQSLKLWSAAQATSRGMFQESMARLKQQVFIDDRSYLFTWNIELENDSTSRVEVLIAEPGNSLVNRITIPFVNTNIEQDTEEVVRDFYSNIRDHISEYTIDIEGVTRFDSVFCIYTPIKTHQTGKGKGMVSGYFLLSSFINDNDLKLNGLPFLEVTKWNMAVDSIEYKFCFPIERKDSIPSHPDIDSEFIEKPEVIKATYFGNYISSDRTWYALLNYARLNGIETTGLPIEVFHNNPTFGGNKKEWQADVYMPIK